MAAVLSGRLGKRSLLGSRVAAPDGIRPAPPGIPGFSRRGEDGAPGSPGSPNPEFLNPGSPNPEFPNPGNLHGQQVPPPPPDEAGPGFPTGRRGQDELRARNSHPGIPPRSVSSSIDVPKRRPPEPVDMDEMVAALVLSGLSCSPGPAPGDPWRDGGDVSDSGSSTTSGHWSSVTSSPPHGSVTLSPPHGAAMSPLHGTATMSPPHGTATMSPPHGGAMSPPIGSVTMSPPHCAAGVTASPPRGTVTMSPVHDGVTTSPPHGTATMSRPYSSVTTSPPHIGVPVSPPHGAVTTSPPHTGATTSPPHVGVPVSPPRVGVPVSPPRGAVPVSPLPDDGFDTDPELSPPAEPTPRRRKAPVVFRCLWPGCGKVLRSGVGIKRHVRTRHLRDGSEREEDFYFTELQVAPEPPSEPPPPAATSVTAVTTVTPVTAVTAVTPVTVAVAGATPCSAPIVIPGQPGLGHSAPPGSLWHIRADHAYQALPSIQIPVSPHIFTSISWAAATSPLPSLSPVRSGSLGAPRPQLLVSSPPRASLASRKSRGEAKKCRKVYGVEQRERWCTACRWKKACQRFLD